MLRTSFHRQCSSRHLRRILAIILVAVGSTAAFPDVITYIRFEEGSGYGAFDETGLLNGELLGFPDVSPGAGDTGGGWSTIVPSSLVPLTGAPNTGSLRMGGIAYVDLSNGNDLSLGATFTVEFYMRPDYPIISSAFGFGPGSSLYFSMSDNLGTPYFNFQFMSELPYAPATSVTFGAWQHVALVKRPGEYSLYLDGVVVAQDSLPASTDGPYFFPGVDEVGNRTIGGESGTFYGWIDEFRISDTALTPDQFLGAFVIPEPSTFLLTLLCLAAFARRLSRGRRNES
jgi:hypothetical protein